MKDPLWPTEVSERLREYLSGTFTGVQFQTAPLAVYDVVTLDVSWTDGPALHEVDLVALQIVLRLHLDTWGTSNEAGSRIDRISKRRTMSPVAEEMLLKVLAADLGTGPGEQDLERFYTLPPVLAASRYRAEKGTIPEFLDLLFEATSFRGSGVGDGDIGGPDTLLCRCALCA
ncbi:hypothetical protein ABIB35_001980 [Arthrobacter sp. UYP6]|uniref:hypothetical protein n=1 Tax=Arthrobacter sp. UYP6 TaxID=1756378 RepID=UPI0033974489